MNARALVKRMRRSGRTVFWGNRVFPSIVIPAQLCAVPPPAWTPPPGWRGLWTWRTPDGSKIALFTICSTSPDLAENEVRVHFAAGSSMPYFSMTGLRTAPDGTQTHLTTVELEPYCAVRGWMARDLVEILQPALFEHLREALFYAKTHYIDWRADGCARLTLSAQPKMPFRLQKIANGLRNTVRWAKRHHNVKLQVKIR